MFWCQPLIRHDAISRWDTKTVDPQTIAALVLQPVPTSIKTPVVKKTAKKTTRKRNEPDFEAAIKELESLVERMEQGEQTLEQSLRDFERGVELTRTCQTALKAAEQKVQQLLTHNGEAADLAPFDEE